MKKGKIRKRKINLLKCIILIIIIFFISKLINIYSTYSKEKYENKNIAEEKNLNYSGIGQEKVGGKDGYFTTFTTISENKKVYKEYKQNGEASWANNDYWGGNMKDNGCGITAMAIILSGYGREETPEELRKKYYPVLAYENLSKELENTFGIENSDFYYDSIHLSEEKLTEHLSTNRPVLICVWNKPKKNRWTTESHYMVLLATDGKEKVYISNPNGLENTNKNSGWYKFDDVVPYIAKAMYIETYN